MSLKLFLTAMLSLHASLFAIDNSFELVRSGEKVNIYGPKRDHCTGEGSSVLFVIENKTKNRLKLRMEILNEKVKNRLTVVVEPTGNTSVLSLAQNMETCHVQIVDMQVKELAPPTIRAASTAPARPAPAATAPAARSAAAPAPAASAPSALRSSASRSSASTSAPAVPPTATANKGAVL